MPTNINVSLAGSYVVTDNGSSTTPVNRTLSNLVANLSEQSFSSYVLVGVSQIIPPGQGVGASAWQVAIVKNLSASNLVSVYLALGNLPTSPSCILGPNGVIILLNPGVNPGNSQGIGQIQLQANAINTPVEVLLAF